MAEHGPNVCVECKMVARTPELPTCSKCRRPFCDAHIKAGEGHKCRILHYKMVFLVDRSLGMSAGKVGAQVGHAAVELALLCAGGNAQAFRNEARLLMFNDWHSEGGKKVVLGVKDEDEMEHYSQLAADKGLPVVQIRDYGLTEVKNNSLTVVGIGPGKSEDIDIVTGGLKTL